MMILFFIFNLVGCGTSYWTYRQGDIPLHISHVREIPIWIDDEFKMGERLEIARAVGEWNQVFNGQLKLRFAGTFHGSSGIRGKIIDIRREHMGWIIIRIDGESSSRYVDEGTLAFANERGGDMIAYIYDRIGSRRIKDIMMHEIGHLLGADHVSGESLMNYYYGDQQLDCIDKITVSQVAGYLHLNLSELNYCSTPTYP